MSASICNRKLIPAADSFCDSFGFGIFEKYACSRCPFCDCYVADKFIQKTEKVSYLALAIMFKCPRQQNELMGYFFINDAKKCEQGRNNAMPRHCDILYRHEKERAAVIAQIDMNVVDKAVEEFSASITKSFADYKVASQEKIMQYVNDCEKMKQELMETHSVEYRKFDEVLEKERYISARIAHDCYYIADKAEKQLRTRIEAQNSEQ